MQTRRIVRLCFTAVTSLVLLICVLPINEPAFAGPQESPRASSPSSIAKPVVYVSLDRVPRNSPFEVAVVIQIAAGFHMNSNKPSESYLIPTTLALQLPSGFQILGIVYPPGRLEKFAFSPEKQLSVYTEKAEIRIRISAQANALLGTQVIPAILRYQACNSTTCLPPAKIPLNLRLLVVPVGTSARPAHPEIFLPVHSS